MVLLSLGLFHLLRPNINPTEVLIVSKLTKPLKYPGGKHYLAKEIINLFPSRDKYNTYVEPYCGGANVLLEHDPTDKSEIINDLNLSLTHFWRVLQNPDLFWDFKRILEVTPFSEIEFQNAIQNLSLFEENNTVRNAVDFFIACRQSRAANFKGFATLTKTRLRRGMNEQVSAWLAAIAGLPEICDRLRRVLILNRSALEVIQEFDNSHTVLYLDPPYLHETRTCDKLYYYEMSKQDHIELLDVVTKSKSFILLSGYPNELYTSKLKDWIRRDISIPNHLAGGEDKRLMCESIWRNF